MNQGLGVLILVEHILVMVPRLVRRLLCLLARRLDASPAWQPPHASSGTRSARAREPERETERRRRHRGDEPRTWGPYPRGTHPRDGPKTCPSPSLPSCSPPWL